MFVPSSRSRIEQESAGLTIVFPESYQAAKILQSDPGAAFHLNCRQSLLPIENEVDFMSFRRPPVMNGIAMPSVVIPRAQVLQDESFECRSLRFFRNIEWASGTYSAEHTSIKQEE